MQIRITSLERAFQIAKSGDVTNLSELKAALRREAYDLDQVQGHALRQQLRAVIKAARALKQADPTGGRSR